MAKDIKWKFNYVRPQAPDTKGFLAIHVERGRFQVRLCEAQARSITGRVHGAGA